MISIVTPSYNQLDYLKRCCASVADQSEPCEHFVADGGSTDGSGEWLRQYDAEVRARSLLPGGITRCGAQNISDLNPGRPASICTFGYISERDSGMYNALNKAYAATAGEIVGHLNCDEQYLPGTLQFVARYFQNRPKVDVLFGAVVVTDAQGNYICSRMPMKPQLIHTVVSNLYNFTATMFVRRSAIEKLDCYYDDTFKIAGDADLICRMLKAKIQMATARRYFSVFVDTGKNLALSSSAQAEQRRLAARAPAWAQNHKGLVELQHRVRKLCCGAYCLKPFEYKFIEANGSANVRFVSRPRGRWTNRLRNSTLVNPSIPYGQDASPVGAGTVKRESAMNKQTTTEEKNKVYYDTLYGHRSLMGFKIHALLSFDQKSKARPLRKVLMPLIDRIYKATGSKLKVLDYGCGWGNLISSLPFGKIEVSIFDISGVCVDRVRRLMELRKAPCMVVSKNPSTDRHGGFDMIICSHVLEHVPSDRDLLAEFRASLKDDGMLIVNVPINDVWDDPKHARKYSPVSINQLVADSGYNVIADYQVDRWTALILSHEVRMKFSRVAKMLFKPLRLALAVVPYRITLLAERVFCSQREPQQYIIVARKG